MKVDLILKLHRLIHHQLGKLHLLNVAHLEIDLLVNTLKSLIMQYKVNCPSAPFENTMFPTLDDCWTLCLELSEEYGYAEVLFCALNGSYSTMGSYTNGH